MADKIKVGITHGDVNGIGYEVILKALGAEHLTDMVTPVIYGSAKIAAFYRKSMELPAVQLNTVSSARDAADSRVNIINVVGEDVKVEPGQATKAAGEAAFAALERAVADLRDGLIDAVVTAPIDKDTIQSPTFTFPGHTEYLESSLADAGRDKALMILCSDRLRVALVTAHMPLAKVAQAVTREAVLEKIRVFSRSLVEDFEVSSPRIAVLALNPHAGDNGLLGSEEAEVISPAIADAQEEGILVFGPYAADGLFGSGGWSRFDGVLAMYHDQGLAPFKSMAMDAGVNVTAGLPYVRTSPDHGTAFDIAGKGVASPESMRAAIFAAVDIVRSRRRYAEMTANPLKKQSADKRRSREQKNDDLTVLTDTQE